jgi:hypothetical protein
MLESMVQDRLVATASSDSAPTGNYDKQSHRTLEIAQ